MQQPVGQAHRERVSHFVGVGCLLQALGLVAPFIFGAAFGVVGAAIGVVVLVVLVIVGSNKATSWRCGGCKNPLASKAVKMCPICKATLD